MREVHAVGLQAPILYWHHSLPAEAGRAWKPTAEEPERQVREAGNTPLLMRSTQFHNQPMLDRFPDARTRIIRIVTVYVQGTVQICYD